jgi:hypothetical protein
MSPSQTTVRSLSCLRETSPTGFGKFPHGWGSSPIRSAAKLRNWFIFSAGVTLAVTGVAKVFSASSNAGILGVQDPIFGVSFRHLMLLVGLAELVIAVICLHTNKQRLSLGLVAWIAASILLYRIGLWAMDWKGPCGCLGSLTDALPMSPKTVDWLMKALLAYLLIGSCAGLVRRRRLEALEDL